MRTERASDHHPQSARGIGRGGICRLRRIIASPARGLALALASGAALTAGLAIAAPVASAEAFVLPVSFHGVKNINDSGVKCESGGGEPSGGYTVRGHLTGPRVALEGTQSPEVTLYLTGFEEGEWVWRFKAVRGHNFAAVMAGKGHVSLTIDMLGYGASDHPNGSQLCMGSQAAVTHQLIQRLRKHEYTVDKAGVAPIEFAKVVLVGTDVGGAVAEIEAYSYKDIDALITNFWADQGFTAEPFKLLAKFNEVCAKGGEEGNSYAHFAPQEESYWRENLFADNAEQSLIEAAFRMREANPCGYGTSISLAVTTGRIRDSEIHVPVLIMFGNEKPLVWTREGQEEQEKNYTGTSDKETVFIPEAAHFAMLERTVPTAGVVSSWLCKRNLVAIPCKVGS